MTNSSMCGSRLNVIWNNNGFPFPFLFPQFVFLFEFLQIIVDFFSSSHESRFVLTKCFGLVLMNVCNECNENFLFLKVSEKIKTSKNPNLSMEKCYFNTSSIRLKTVLS